MIGPLRTGGSGRRWALGVAVSRPAVLAGAALMLGILAGVQYVDVNDLTLQLDSVAADVVLEDVVLINGTASPGSYVIARSGGVAPAVAKTTESGRFTLPLEVRQPRTYAFQISVARDPHSAGLGRGTELVRYRQSDPPSAPLVLAIASDHAGYRVAGRAEPISKIRVITRGSQLPGAVTFADDTGRFELRFDATDLEELALEAENVNGTRSAATALAGPATGEPRTADDVVQLEYHVEPRSLAVTQTFILATDDPALPALLRDAETASAFSRQRAGRITAWDASFERCWLSSRPSEVQVEARHGAGATVTLRSQLFRPPSGDVGLCFPERFPRLGSRGRLVISGEGIAPAVIGPFPTEIRNSAQGTRQWTYVWDLLQPNDSIVLRLQPDASARFNAILTADMRGLVPGAIGYLLQTIARASIAALPLLLLLGACLRTAPGVPASQATLVANFLVVALALHTFTVLVALEFVARDLGLTDLAGWLGRADFLATSMVFLGAMLVAALARMLRSSFVSRVALAVALGTGLRLSIAITAELVQGATESPSPDVPLARAAAWVGGFLLAVLVLASAAWRANLIGEPPRHLRGAAALAVVAVSVFLALPGGWPSRPTISSALMASLDAFAGHLRVIGTLAAAIFAFALAARADTPEAKRRFGAILFAGFIVGPGGVVFGLIPLSLLAGFLIYDGLCVRALADTKVVEQHAAPVRARRAALLDASPRVQRDLARRRGRRPFVNLAYGPGPEVRDDVRLGVVVSVFLAIALLLFARPALAPGSDPTYFWQASVLGVANSMARWLLIGAFFALYFTWLRTDAGVTKGLLLAVGIILSHLPAQLIGLATGGLDTIAIFLGALQLLGFGALLGLAFDLRTVRLSTGLGLSAAAERVVKLVGARGAVTVATTVVSAIAAAVLTRFTSEIAPGIVSLVAPLVSPLIGGPPAR